MDIPLNELSLEKRWPRLAKLEDEVKSLEKRLGQAEAQAQQLQNQLGPARNLDLDAEAKAVRAGKPAPEPTHEPEAQRKLERATRERDVLQRAVECTRQDLATFQQKKLGALYLDVADARDEIASAVAGAAQEALRGFGRWSDMHYTLKGLRPAEEVEDWTGPANPNSVSIIGVATRGPQGPARGDIEGMLQYLIGLAAPAAPEAPAPGDSDAAA